MSERNNPIREVIYPNLDGNLNSGVRTLMNQPIMERYHEAGEIASDLALIGGVALASEIEAAKITDVNTDPTVQLPMSPRSVEKDTRKHWVFEPDEEGKLHFVRKPMQNYKSAHESVKGTQSELDIANAEESTIEDAASLLELYLHRFTRHVDAEQKVPWRGWEGNGDMILDSANIPPFIRMIKEKSGAKTWADWLASASPEQVTNFSQWYKTELDKVADPQKRETYITTLKSNYSQDVDQAISDGWIDSRLAGNIQKRIKKAKIMFFSPFGRMPNEAGGLHDPNNSQVLLPIIGGRQIVNHELGHAIGGVDFKGISKFAVKVLGKDSIHDDKAGEATALLYTILDEGYNEHVTIALANGSPTIISPENRANAGVQDPEGSSDLYKIYREIFNTLVSGPEGHEISQTDLLAITTSMIDGKFEDFDQFIEDRWGGRPILGEILQMLYSADKSMKPDQLLERIRQLTTKIPTTVAQAA